MIIKSVFCLALIYLVLGNILFQRHRSLVRINSQLCDGISQYNQCSTNIACGCFDTIDMNTSGICAFLHVTCSALVSCLSSNNICYQPNHICVRHPRCFSHPVCYPLSMIDLQICPSKIVMNTTMITTTTTTASPSIIDILPNSTWSENGITVAGGQEEDDGLNQLNFPLGLYVDDDDGSVLIADDNNHRIIEWKFRETTGRVVAGGNGQGNGSNQLDSPTDVTLDKKTNSLIICDMNNRRIVQWPRRGGTNGQTIISNVSCYGLTTDYLGFIYVADYINNEVRRWQIGETERILVAGGNDAGHNLDQLNNPTCVFVDHDQSVYVSDEWNNRVMKWMKNAKEGIIVAGGQGKGNDLSQLSYPQGLVIDHLGTLYISDLLNHRIMRWTKGATEGSIIIGEYGEGTQPNQLSYPNGLSFDRYGNFYVVDKGNNRVQMFLLDGDD